MVTKEDLIMTKHAQDEAMDDGISRIEIAEAVGRGPRVPEGNHFITIIGTLLSSMNGYQMPVLK